MSINYEKFRDLRIEILDFRLRPPACRDFGLKVLTGRIPSIPKFTNP
jgi:hypothetical protein